MKLKNLLKSLLIVLAAQTALGQTASVSISTTGDDGYIRRISNNGKWGVIEKSGTVEGSITPGGGYLVNLETAKRTDISHSSGLSGVGDVTDDGTIVVGEAQTKPAYYSTVDNTWHTLSLPLGGTAGRLESVTPDGKYAVGYYLKKPQELGQDFDTYLPIMYDLTTGKVVATPGMPETDMQHENHHMTMASEISPDGRYIIGRVSQSYLMPPGLFSFVYDRETSTYKPIGFTENKTAAWKPDIENTLFCDFPFMSANGQWIVGTAYRVEEIPGSEFGNEYKVVYRYNIATGEYVEYNNGASEQNIDGTSVLNDGTVTAATPSESPYADGLVRSGKYFVTLDQILKQVYKVNFADKTGWDNTGKIISVSDDGKTFVTLVGPKNTFIVTLPEALSEAAAKVDLMADYTISPAPGTTMSKLKTFDVKFDREIQLVKNANTISFKAADGTTYNALSAVVSSNATTTLSITFRTRSLTDGVEYTLNIPAGMVCLKGDKDMPSKEITVTYKGRDDSPMKLVKAYPAEGADVAFLDANNNPVQLEFDVNLAYTADAIAYLYRDDEPTPFSPMNFSIGENKMLLYPSARINLFKGSKYKLVIAPNSVTDVTGGCANQEITINWNGSYVREWSTDDKFLFNEECDNFDNFMFYEGDCRVPAEEPAAWGFQQYTTPWWVTRDSQESTDMAFASHSMYSPAGQADDWCVIPQIFIPDTNCYLTFDAQGYRKDKNDVLKVYVYEQDNVYNVLNANIVNAIRTEGDLVFNKRLDPGLSEGLLEGDWTNYVVKLDKYVGKPIYIAFVNDNNDQSALFLDNIQVIHDMHYLVSIESKSRVVNADDIAIRGNITVASEVDNFKNLQLILKDADNNTVSTVSENVDLKKGDVYTFEFPEKLALTKGESNKYYVDVTLDNINTLVNGEVKNLVFEPYRRVVIEEYSGRDCGNCPMGFLAMENIEKKFPGRLIPIVIRTYQGDPLGNTVTGYSNYLGMPAVGAPSGRVNRGEILSPSMQANGTYSFVGAPYDDYLWYDAFLDQIAEPAEANISFTSSYDPATSTATVNTTVTHALSGSNTGINLFAVVMEDGCDAGYQSNYFANVSSDLLGDWGKGGKYAQAYVVPFTINDVARTTWGNTFQGTGGLIPSTVESGKEYNNTLTIKLPSAVEKPANCKVAVMLIDAAKGNVINANVGPINGSSLENPAGVDDIMVDNTPGFDANAPVEYYNLQGVRIAAPAPGQIVIRRQGNHATKLIIR